MLDILFWGARRLQQQVTALQLRVDALESAQMTHLVERNALLTSLTSTESRLRAMLSRAERTAAPQKDTATALDAAVLNRKGYS